MIKNGLQVASLCAWGIFFVWSVPLETFGQDDFWGGDSGGGSSSGTKINTSFWDEGGRGGNHIGWSKTDSSTRAKLYADWIKEYKVEIADDGIRTIVSHRHSEECRRKGYCYLSRGIVQGEVVTTNIVRQLTTAKIRLAYELKKQSWLVQIIDKPSPKSFAGGVPPEWFLSDWILVDFEQLKDPELFDGRVVETPLHRKKETRRVLIPAYKGSSKKEERKLPVFSDSSEVSDYTETTNIVVETKSDVIETPVRYMKPTMQDFGRWIQSGNSMSYHMKFTDTCPSCKHRGRWTEWRDGKHQIITCSRCNGSGSIWIEKDVTVRGP